MQRKPGFKSGFDLNRNVTGIRRTKPSDPNDGYLTDGASLVQPTKRQRRDPSLGAVSA